MISEETELKPVSGENVLYETHPSMFRNRPAWYAGIVGLILLGFGVLIYSMVSAKIPANVGATVCAILSGIGIVSYIIWWLRCKATTLTVTTNRTSCRRGILSKSISEVWHQDVRNVQLDQTFMQRVLDVGTIGVSSAAQSGLEIEVRGIPDPDRVKQLIDEHRSR
jgi:uncharacterized membrane protein YdbT with pleckstrin-like domain